MYLCKPFTINENSSTPWTQPIWVNHVHLVFAFLSLSIYILIHTSDRSNLAKVTNLTFSVVPKSSLILCINIWRRLWERHLFPLSSALSSWFPPFVHSLLTMHPSLTQGAKEATAHRMTPFLHLVRSNERMKERGLLFKLKSMSQKLRTTRQQ